VKHPKSREEKLNSEEYFRFRHGGFSPGTYDKDRYGYEGYDAEPDAERDPNLTEGRVRSKEEKDLD